MTKKMAIVKGNKVVNVISASEGEKETETLINCSDYLVSIGDTYQDGKFSRNGEEFITPLEKAERKLEEQEQAHLEELAELISEIYSEDEGLIEE